jgi:hypothetical protein
MLSLQSQPTQLLASKLAREVSGASLRRTGEGTRPYVFRIFWENLKPTCYSYVNFVTGFARDGRHGQEQAHK